MLSKASINFSLVYLKDSSGANYFQVSSSVSRFFVNFLRVIVEAKSEASSEARRDAGCFNRWRKMLFRAVNSQLSTQLN